MSEAVHAVADEASRGPAAPGAEAADVGMPRFGRSLLAPFVFGLVVGYIWLLIRQAVWINALLGSVNALSSVPPIVLLALAIGPLVVLPGAVAVISTVGDARFWGAGSMAWRASAGVRLALALVAALVVGNWSWLSSFAASGGLAAEAGRQELVLRILVFNNVVNATSIVQAQWEFLIGVLAAFTFERWPVVRTRRLGPPFARVGRWLVVGALAAAGLLFFDGLEQRVFFVPIGALWLHLPVCAGEPCTTFALEQLAAFGQQLGGALAGAVVGGVLRAGPLAMWRRDTSAEPAGGMRTAARPARRWAPARVGGALGLGLLCGAAWIGAIVAVLFMAQFLAAVALPQRAGAEAAAVRSSGAAALLVALLGAVVPLSILVAGAITRGRHAETARGQSARFVLALAGVLVGVAPAYVMVRGMPLAIPALLIGMLPFVTPGFSAGVALGYTLGVRGNAEAARAEGWWRGGTQAAFWGGIGFGLTFVGLVVALLASAPVRTLQCSRLPCLPVSSTLTPVTVELMLASITTVALVALGGVAGAWLRLGVAPRRRAR